MIIRMLRKVYLYSTALYVLTTEFDHETKHLNIILLRHYWQLLIID